MIAAGLRKYGFDEDFALIFEALLEAAVERRGLPAARAVRGLLADGVRDAGAVSRRLPAAGLGGRRDPVPRRRRASGWCRTGCAGRLRVRRPSLPRWLNRVEVRGLRIAGARVDLLFERAGAGGQVALTDARIDGDVEVVLEISGFARAELAPATERARPSRARAPSGRRPSRPGRGSRPGSAASAPAAVDRVELRRQAEPVERVEHAGAHALGRIERGRRRAARPSRARSRTARRRRGDRRAGGRRGARTRACAARSRVSTSGCARRSAAAAAASPSSAPAHSSQPSCEPAPGDDGPVALDRHHVGAPARQQRPQRRGAGGPVAGRVQARERVERGDRRRLAVGVGQRRRRLGAVGADDAGALGMVLDGRDRVAPALLREAAGAAPRPVPDEPAARVERAASASRPPPARTRSSSAVSAASPSAPSTTRNQLVASAVP